MNKQNRKCLKGLQHRFELVEEYATHTVKECERCHVKNWQVRRNFRTGNVMKKSVPIPTNVVRA